MQNHYVKRCITESHNMFDFFNEFFQSELVKNNIATVIIISILLILIGAGLMWLYMSKIHMMRLENENADLKRENEKIKSDIQEVTKAYKDLEERLKSLTASSDRLKFLDEQYIARNTDMSDSALEEFLKDR